MATIGTCRKLNELETIVFSGTSNCPECNKFVLAVMDTDYDGDVIVQAGHCRNCHKTIVVVFTARPPRKVLSAHEFYLTE